MACVQTVCFEKFLESLIFVNKITLIIVQTSVQCEKIE